MSKRSDVALIISKQVYENMKNELSKEEYNNDGHFYGLELITEDVDKKIENNNFVLLKWNYIKWNIFFEDVSSVEDYLSSLKEEYSKRLDNNEEITDQEILDKYAYELLIISEDGTSYFKCYDEDGYEYNVYLMPDLYNGTGIVSEMEKSKIYVVNELTRLMSDQFEIYNVCYKSAFTLKKAQQFMHERLEAAKQDFKNISNIIECDTCITIELDNDDCVEINIDEIDLY